MARIGIMGGTFNPVHNVHLIMAEEARRQFQLKKVLFMPSKNPPHKKKRSIASDEHRKRMIQHAIQDNPAFVFSDLELEREGTTYTKDTLAALKQLYPNDKFYFIVGGDSLASMEKWYEPAYIFKNCRVLAANRDETDGGQIRKLKLLYEKKYGAKIAEIQMPPISISSEMIRNKLAEHSFISGYVPACVERYIRANQLYGCMDPLFLHLPSEREVIRYLAANLKPKRFLHTLGVAATAANLAAIHHANPKEAYLAGLLHDCAKYLTGEEELELCEQEQIPLSDVERKNTVLIHGKLGAHFARTRYGVENEEILSAIRFHTTGRPGMGLLEKIIYLADYMEPGRKMECQPYTLTEIRKMCYIEIDEALRMVLESCICYLQQTQAPIDPLTMETYQYYSREENEHAECKGNGENCL